MQLPPTPPPVSVQAMALAEGLARRVAQHGGAALIIDYGQDAPYEASLQAIRQHQFVGLLEGPGGADISNRVDYSALRCAVVWWCVWGGVAWGGHTGDVVGCGGGGGCACGRAGFEAAPNAQLGCLPALVFTRTAVYEPKPRQHPARPPAC